MAEKYFLEPIKIEFEHDPHIRNNLTIRIDYIIATTFTYTDGMQKAGSGIEKGSITFPISILDKDGSLKDPELIADFTQNETVRDHLPLIRECFKELRGACMEILKSRVLIDKANSCEQ